MQVSALEYYRAWLSDVGLKFKIDPSACTTDQRTAGEIYLSFTGTGYDVNPWSVDWTSMVPLRANNNIAPQIGVWVETQGAKGQGPGADPTFLPLAAPDAFPSDNTGDLQNLIDHYQNGRAHSMFSPERIEHGKSIFTINALQQFAVGTIAFADTGRNIYLNRNNVRNQPYAQFHDHYGYFAWTYYFEDGIDNISHSDRRSQAFKSQSFLGGIAGGITGGK
jgi:hypothetical protein